MGEKQGLAPTHDQLAELARHLEFAKNHRAADGQGPQSTFLIGAGASVSSGMPLGKTIVSKAQEMASNRQIQADVDELQDYQKVMRCLTRNQIDKVFEACLDDPRPSWGYLALASLVQHGFVTQVLSLNFDTLLTQAAALGGLFMPTYDLAAAHDTARLKFQQHAIVHLHGQSHGPTRINTDDDNRKIAARVRQVLERTIDQGDLYIVGYGGESDQHFEALVQTYDNQHRLFWLGYTQSHGSEIGKLFENQHASYFEGCDFDQTMISLAKALDVWPPNLVAFPLAQAAMAIRQFKAFPRMGDDKGGVFSDWEAVMGQFFDLKSQDPAYQFHQEFADMEAGGDLVPSAIKSMSEELGQDIETSAEDLAHDIRAWEELRRAAKAHDEENWDECERIYGMLTHDYPKMHEAWNNWGNALSSQGDLTRNSDFYDSAIEKYGRAGGLAPNKPWIWTNWGTALGKKAALTGNFTLFDQADSMFAKATKISSQMCQPWYKWGEILMRKAMTLGDAESYDLASEKFAKAAEIEPSSYLAWNDWGTALEFKASAMRNPHSYDLSEEKFVKATEIEPQNPIAWSNWGNILKVKAKVKKDKDLMKEAVNKYRHALEVSSQAYYPALHGLASLEGDRGNAIEAIKWLKKLKKVPPSITQQDLLKNPNFNPIRNHEAFQKFLASLPES